MNEHPKARKIQPGEPESKPEPIMRIGARVLYRCDVRRQMVEGVVVEMARHRRVVIRQGLGRVQRKAEEVEVVG